MNLGHERAGSVDDAERPLLGFLPDRGWHSVGAENQHRTGGNFRDGFHKDGSAASELLDNIGIVHDLVVHVDRRAVGLQSQFDNVHRTNHTSAESPRADPKQSFRLSLYSHQFPKLPNLQNSIIPKSAF